MLREQRGVERPAEWHDLRFHAIHARRRAQRRQHFAQQAVGNFGLRKARRRE